MLDWAGEWPRYWPLRVLILVAALAIFLLGIATGIIAVHYPGLEPAYIRVRRLTMEVFNELARI